MKVSVHMGGTTASFPIPTTFHHNYGDHNLCIRAKFQFASLLDFKDILDFWPICQMPCPLYIGVNIFA